MRRIIELFSKTLSEAEVNPGDVKAVFKTAAVLRDEPQSRWDRLTRRKPKDKISTSDLQHAWQQAGYPDDIRDIEHILKDAGFGEKEINKIFSDVFGKADDGEYADPVDSPAVLKIAKYAKLAGIDTDLLDFMRKEYGFKESSVYDGKVLAEQVRDIFTNIVHEDRSGLSAQMKSMEHQQLGRNKK